MRKIAVLALSLLIGFSLGITTVVASEDTKGKTYYANFVYAKDVNIKGTNLTSSNTDGRGREITKIPFRILSNPNGTVKLFFSIKNEDIVVSGSAIAKTGNGDTIFYEGQSSNHNYSVVYFALAYNVEKTNYYFKDYISTDSKVLLQLYMRDNASSTKDYYLLEADCFDVQISPSVIMGLEINPLFGAWAANEFEPISCEFKEEIISNKLFPSKSYTSTKYWVCTETYYDMGETQSHTIKWLTNIDYSNVPIGQNATQYYHLEVYAKNMTFSVNTSFNSNTMSYLHIDGLSLDQISVKNTAWKSTLIDGYVQNNNIWGGNLSADIGVGYGALGVTLSFPLSFTGSYYVDINSPYTGYLNGINGNYTRAIKTNMDSNFKLTQIGHYFEVESVLRDYGNSSSSSSVMKARWHVDIFNAGNQNSNSYYCDHDVYISIN